MTTAVQSTDAPTVLVVDDEPDIRDLARAVLEMDGLDVVDVAEDGPAALARFRELRPPPVPTVVLLDNRMPGLTGLEVAEQMLAQYAEQIIVLFSAYLDDGIEARAEAIGVAACVSKTEVGRLPEIIRALLPSA